MKRFTQLFVIALLAISFSSVKAGNYRIDDKALDEAFATANPISFEEMSVAAMPGLADLNSPAFAYDKDPLVAILLDVFVGYLGIHRFYLGTEPLTGIAYILTGGGCGIVWLIDLVVLATNYDDISPYIDNPRFFMW